MKNNYIKLTLIWITSKFRDIFFPKQIKSSSKKIGKFKLIRRIEVGKKTRDFILGEYEYKNKRYFIKSWYGLIKDFSYFNLIYEYKLSKLLSNKRYEKWIKIKFIKPQLLIEDVNSVSVVYPFILGKKLSSYPLKYQVKVIDLIVDNLMIMSQKLDSKSLKYFSIRNKYFYLIYAFIALFVIFLRGKKKVKDLFSFTTSMAMDFILDNQKTIAHGDLHPDNILISNNNIYLLDCENMMLSVANYDIYNLISMNKFSRLSNIMMSNLSRYDIFILSAILIKSSEYVFDLDIDKLI